MKKKGFTLSLLVFAMGGFISTSIAQTDTFNLPKPYATPVVNNFSKVLNWPEGKTPTAPDGFTVTRFADGFNNPRWIYVAPNGDIFISDAATEAPEKVEYDKHGTAKTESQNYGSANSIVLLRDSKGDHSYSSRHVYKTGLNQPFGMLVIDKHFYVANTDALLRFDYDENSTQLTGEGQKIVDLPAGG